MTKKELVGIRLRPTTKKKLENQAKTKEMNLSELIREILEHYVHINCE